MANAVIELAPCCGVVPVLEVSTLSRNERTVYEVRCYRCGRATGEQFSEMRARLIWSRQAKGAPAQ